MSNPGKQKDRKSKEATTKREVKTSFMEDSAGTSQKTGHSKSLGAAVSRGREGTKEISSITEATGEPDQVKQKEKKSGPFGKIRKTFSKHGSHSSKSSSKHAVQSPTSPTSPSDASPRLSKRAEETTEREPFGADISVRKASTISSCDSQASGGPVSPSTEQVRSLEERIHQLEQKLQDTSSKRLEEELQHKELEVSTELQEKHDAALEEKVKQKLENDFKARLSQREQDLRQESQEALQQQQQGTERELVERDRKHKVEMERQQKQYELQLDSKQKVVRTALQKQLRDKEEEINAKNLEINKLQEQLAQKEVRSTEAQQQVRNSQAKVVQTQESELQKLKDELTEKKEELRMKLREKETQVQRFVQKAEKRLQESQKQLQQEQARHAQERKEMTENYEAQLQKAAQQHDTEKDKLLSESQVLQQEQKRCLEDMTDKIRQYEEQQRDIPQQSDRGTDQVTKDHEVQIEQLKLQHKRALEEKDRKLSETLSRLQEEMQKYEKDMMKRRREFQTKFADAEQRYKAQLDDKQKQYESSLSDLRKRQANTLEMQAAQAKRNLEKELQTKEEENTREVEQRIQQREQVLQQELQQREQELQQREQELQRREQVLQEELQQREQELQRREQVLQEELQQREQVLEQELQRREQVLQEELQQKLHQQDTQLRRYEQKVIEKDAKIAQLESDLSGMIPSSEPPSEESPSKDQSATLRRVPVQSREDNVAELHSNVVDLAREISRYVDPENVLPSVECCHHLTPPEVKRVVEVLGGHEQLQGHKPQNYCFAVLPADNQKQSVLFDYTGTFRPSPDDQVCPLPVQEEEPFHTPPSTPTTEVPQMNPLVANASDVAANLPDSEKVERLQKALDGHIRLHADMTDEVERGKNEIADLRREMDAKEEALRAQGDKLQLLRQSVEEKEQEIEDKVQKVEQRDRQLDYLKKPLNDVELNPKALEEYDKYFDHVLKLTEELTHSEATVRKQQQELEKLQRLVERAERMEEQVTHGAVELSEKEQEIKELRKRPQHAAVSKDVEELEDEVDRLRSVEQKTEGLHTQLKQVQSDLHEQCQQKSELESKLIKLEEDMGVKEMELKVVLRDLEDLKEENGKLELQLKQRELSLMRSQGASEEALQVKMEAFNSDQVKALQEKLQARDEELESLRQQATGSGVPLQASLKFDDLPPGTDPRVEIAMLKKALESKEQKLESLQVQLRSFEDVMKHTKEQSKQVLKLKRELSAIKKEKETLKGEEIPIEDTREDQTGTDLVPQLEQLLAIAESEKLRMEQERNSYRMEVEELRGDLEVTHNEVAKEEKKQKGDTVGLRLQLAAQKSEQDQLHHQLEQTEATVRKLETHFNLSQARVAELEGEITKLEEGITGMKAVLSESEHNRQALFQELSKVKKQRDTLDQKCLSLLALNENLKSQASQVDCVLDEITQVKREASKWKAILSTTNAEVGALKKENDDLKGEIAAQKAQAALWEEDFQRERRDREQAAGRIDDERAQLHIQNQQVQEDFQTRINQLESENKRLQDEIKVHQDEKKNYQQVMTDYDRMQLQLAQHKENMADMEQLFQTQQQGYKTKLEQANRLQHQLEEVRRQLRQSNQQLDQAVTDNEKLNDDVLAKTQQVKQYKKQVDGLKAEVNKYKSHGPAKEELDMQTAICESKQTEAARQLEEVSRKLEEARRRSEELREERDALKSEVEQLKSGKMNERHFSAAFQKEFEKSGEFQEKYQKEFEMRGEFETKYHQIMDRCAGLFEEVQQLRGVLEHHKIEIPNPPPKQRAPPAEIPGAVTQQPQALMARSSEGALHPPVYRGDPAAHHTSPTVTRADPPPTEIPSKVRPHPQNQYEFHQPPKPIQPLPQQGGDEFYESREQAWVYAQQYQHGEQAQDRGQVIYRAPQQHVRDQPGLEERMYYEHEKITKDLDVKVQMQHEHEHIEAIMAQQRAVQQQQQDHQFHQEQAREMAHQHRGPIRQGYSVDDPRYVPIQRQGGMGPSGPSSMPTSSITAPQLGEGRLHPHPQVRPSDPGIVQYGDLAISHRMPGPQHPNEVDPHLMTSQQQLEKMRFQKRIEQQQILQSQERMRAQQQMVQMEAQNEYGENVIQAVHGYPQDHQGYPQGHQGYPQGHQGYPQMADNPQMQGIPQMQPGMPGQHLLGAYHGQHPAAAPRLYGDSPLPQSHPRYALPAQNVHQVPVSPRLLPPGSDREIAGQYPVGMQPAVSPHHLPPGSDQAQIAGQYPVGVQPTVTPSADQPPQEQYPQGDPITPTEEANRDHAAKVSKPVEESSPGLPEQQKKQQSAQQDENKLMKGLDTEIHDTAADVEANVQSKEELDSLQDAPMDPNLVCPMCGHGYRVGEIQRYRRHVKSCQGSKGQ